MTPASRTTRLNDDIQEPIANDIAAAQMAVDYWKLLRAAERMVLGLPEDKHRRFSAQLRFSEGRLTDHLRAIGVELITFEGQRFGPELPAVAINADDFDGVEELLVDSALEPAVIMRDKVMQNARVMLKKGNSDVLGN